MRRITLALLRARRERPRGRRAADERDELSPPHELPSDEAHNLAHHWNISAPVHRSEIFPLMSSSGSIASFPSMETCVCFTPDSDRCADVLDRQLRAANLLTHAPQ